VVPPAVAVTVTANVDGAKEDQTLLATPTVGNVGTDIVRDADGTIHAQGHQVSKSWSWPDWQGSLAVPIERLEPSGGGLSPLSVPWNDSNPFLN
jgi:hypothetical protein